MNFRHLFGYGTEEYDVLTPFACDKQRNIVSFTAHGPYYQERISIGVQSLYNQL